MITRYSSRFEYFQLVFSFTETLSILYVQDDIPTGDFNKEHFHENLSKEMALQGDDLRGAHSAPNQFLERLSAGRRGPYYKRNLPHICSFWVKVSFDSIYSAKIILGRMSPW